MTSVLAGQMPWYAAGTIFGAAASAALLVVYARALPPDQLAALVLTQAAVTILRIFGTAGAQLGMFRYVAGPAEERAGRSAASLITTTLAFTLVLSAIFGLVSLAVATPVLGNLAGHDARSLMALAALTALVSAPREIAELVLRAEARHVAWAIYSIVASAIITACAVVAALAVAPTAEAILVVQLLGLLVVSLGGTALIRTALGPQLAFAELQSVLRIGLPSAAAVLLDWVLHYMDRFILLAFVGASDIGVYSFGSRIGQMVQQVGGASIQAAWDPYSIRTHRTAGAAVALGRSATLLLVGVLALAVAIGTSAGPLVSVAGGRPEYMAGAAFAFPIGLAYWLGTARNIVMTPLTLRLRPEIGLIAFAAAAVSTVALDLVLIPANGIWGAAIAALCSYAVGAAVGLALGRRGGLIAFESKKLALAFAFSTVAYLGGGLIQTPWDLLTLFARPALALAAFVALVVLTRLVPSPLILLRRSAAAT